jgi:hypothetical protein
VVVWYIFPFRFGILCQEKSGNTSSAVKKLQRHVVEYKILLLPWHGVVVYIVVSSPPAIEETGAMGREIESRQGKGW